ncbi:MAG: hypothetical protein BHW58_00630 [Azospirillum sp. 51_20]|nr:MAG: hypothetical protein BHW58_00630 [Azospirillum sp. 51_20]
MSYLRRPPLSEYYGVLGQKRCFVSTAGKSRFFFRRTGGQGGRRCPQKSKGSMFAREKTEGALSAPFLLSQSMFP